MKASALGKEMHQDVPRTPEMEPNAIHGGASEPRSGEARYRPSLPRVQDSFNPFDDLKMNKWNPNIKKPQSETADL